MTEWEPFWNVILKWISSTLISYMLGFTIEFNLNSYGFWTLKVFVRFF